MSSKRMNSWKATIRSKLDSRKRRPSIIVTPPTSEEGQSGADAYPTPATSITEHSYLQAAPAQASVHAIVFDPKSAPSGKQNSSLSEVPQRPLGNVDELGSSSITPPLQPQSSKYFGSEVDGLSMNSKVPARFPPHYLENLNTKDFSVLIQDLRTRLIMAGGHHTQHYLDITVALEEKYNVLLEEKYNVLLKRKNAPYTIMEEAEDEDQEGKPRKMRG